MADRSRHPLVELSRVRFLEFVREPEAVFWTFVFPIILAIGLGIAFRDRPAETVQAAVVESPGRSVASRLAGTERIRARVVPSLDSARALLRTGEVAIAVSGNADGSVVYHYDSTRPDARTARMVLDDALQRAAGRTDAVPVTEVLVREHGSRYIDFVIPGMIGMGIMANSIWGMGFVIVEARRKKLLKRLVATPMSKLHYLLSFLTFRLVWLVLEVVVILTFAVLAFDVPVRGSPLLFATVVIMSSFAFGGLGLLIASRARTIEGASGLMNFVMMPMWILSGVFFSSRNFPDVIQPFIQALPLTATNDALRATMLRDAGWAAVAPELGILAIWMVGGVTVALRLFRWR